MSVNTTHARKPKTHTRTPKTHTRTPKTHTRTPKKRDLGILVVSSCNATHTHENGRKSNHLHRQKKKTQKISKQGVENTNMCIVYMHIAEVYSRILQIYLVLYTIYLSENAQWLYMQNVCSLHECNPDIYAVCINAMYICKCNVLTLTCAWHIRITHMCMPHRHILHIYTLHLHCIYASAMHICILHI